MAFKASELSLPAGRRFVTMVASPRFSRCCLANLTSSPFVHIRSKLRRCNVCLILPFVYRLTVTQETNFRATYGPLIHRVSSPVQESPKPMDKWSKKGPNISDEEAIAAQQKMFAEARARMQTKSPLGEAL